MFRSMAIELSKREKEAQIRKINNRNKFEPRLDRLMTSNMFIQHRILLCTPGKLSAFRFGG